MTEQEWLECTDPQKILEFLGRKATDRRLRLFACACARQVWHLLTDKRSREAIVVGEQLAERPVDSRVLSQARRGAVAVTDGLYQQLFLMRDDSSAREAIRHAWLTSMVPNLLAQRRFKARTVAIETARVVGTALRVTQRREADSSNPDGVVAFDQPMRGLCGLLQDIFGNPFHPIAVNPSWLTWNDGTVVKLAQSINDDRAFDRLPVLADALDEAGCADAAILGHCRGPGPHVRGCWLVDALLDLT
jgi:hypothetical protein